MLDAYNIMTSVVGVFAVIYPSISAYYFHDTTKLGRASAHMFAGEAFGMLITFIFAVMVIFGMIAGLSEWLITTLHLLTFVVALITSIRHHSAIRDVINADRKPNEKGKDKS